MKPIQARDMIDKMAYDPKIELFARQRFENWDFWGNEVDENTPIQQTLFNDGKFYKR